MHAGEEDRHQITNYIINYAITTVRSGPKKTEGLEACQGKLTCLGSG